MNAILQKLRAIGIQEAETKPNQDRQKLSAIGFRCVSTDPETWRKGNVTVVLTGAVNA